MEKHREIEKSIIKKFRKEIWSEFVKGIKEYQLISENDCIAVCISGGKDSFLLAKCLEELKRHGIFHFDLKYIVMNPGYKKEVVKKIKANAKLLNLDINIFESNIFEVSKSLNEKSPCYLCARMRRGHLYSKAKELGCNKIALGHHFDDVIETTLLSVIYGAEFKTMMPKVRSTNFEALELIRPLYLVKERNVIAWAKYNELEFLNCSCEFAAKETDSKRKEIKTLINNLRQNNKYIEYNIFKSTYNVNLDTIISYKKGSDVVNFLDHYDD